MITMPSLASALPQVTHNDVPSDNKSIEVTTKFNDNDADSTTTFPSVFSTVTRSSSISIGNSSDSDKAYLFEDSTIESRLTKKEKTALEKFRRLIFNGNLGCSSEMIHEISNRIKTEKQCYYRLNTDRCKNVLGLITNGNDTGNESEAIKITRSESSDSEISKSTSYSHLLSTKFLLRFLHVSNMSPDEAYALFIRHNNMITKTEVASVSDSQVKKNYQTGFCQPAGRDHYGRPIIWIVFKNLKVKDIEPTVGIKSTWLALDAALQDFESIKSGCEVVLVYDMRGLGNETYDVAYAAVKSLTKIREYKRAIKAVAFSHPTKISKVYFLDMPGIAVAVWNLLLFMVPTNLKEAVEVVNLKELVEGCYKPINNSPNSESVTDSESSKLGLGLQHQPFADVSQLPIYLREYVKEQNAVEHNGCDSSKLVLDASKIGMAVEKEFRWCNFYTYLKDRVKHDTLLY